MSINMPIDLKIDLHIVTYFSAHSQCLMYMGCWQQSDISEKPI